MHAVAFVAPLASVLRPSGHALHVSAPVSFWYWPERQAAHVAFVAVVLPRGPKEPALQGVPVQLVRVPAPAA